MSLPNIDSLVKQAYANNIDNRKWVFIIAGITCGVLSLLCLTMRESRPSQVLRQKVKKIEKQTGYSNLRIEAPLLPTVKEFTQTSLRLPIRLLFTEPIVSAASVLGAVVVSLIYLFAEAIPIVYSEEFHLKRNTSALVFLIIGAGVLFSFLPRLWDIRKSNQRELRKQIAEPEDKLFGFLVAAPLLAIGLWWFGATIPPITTNIPPYVSMPPVLFVGFASVEFDTVLSGYLTDVYGSHAASANAPMCFLRALVSGVFPIVGRRMFTKLGSSHASFLLASIATLFVAVAVVFRKFGRAIRKRSHFAQSTTVAAEKVADVGEA
jgi:hypothetical protein